MKNLSVLFLLLGFLLFSNSGFAEVRGCVNQPDVVVTTDHLSELPDICLASEKAISFLARYNLHPSRTIYIDVVEEKIDSHGYVAYGSYDSRSDTIQLMSYEAIQAGSNNPTIYGEPFDRVHYSGAIAHEVAHAVVQHNLRTRLLSTGPQEYLAYSTQLAVLPEERRDAIIQAMNIEPWESGDAISDIYMAIEPGKFAVKSYRHLTTMLEPLSFVQILLSAKWFYVYVP